ncbi:alpha/beta hydrolase [Neorhizobium sp. LjRoot104]|uniref:alpha/beta hydrolase n=1 Tax=Neorhizobium sp. LjRoot104 TaxID=3342254 RepID=UPI003ED03678
MEINPFSVFEEIDVRRARRLNRVLAYLPRYHTGRRLNARMINGVVELAGILLRRPRHRDVTIDTVKMWADGREIPIRILRPQNPVAALYLHFHGGAWVLGNSQLDDGWNAEIAKSGNVAIASGDFHLALDDDLKRTIRDAVALTEWALDRLAEFGTDRLIVEGESSGAQLAACALLQVAKTRRLDNVAGFVSFCGAFDMTGSPSLSNARHSLIIDPASAVHNLDRLTRRSDAKTPEISPIFADLRGMPPALFIAGALDPILDDSRKIHDVWQRQTRHADLLVVPEAPHGFERLPTRVAAKARDFMCGWIDKLPA